MSNIIVVASEAAESLNFSSISNNNIGEVEGGVHNLNSIASSSTNTATTNSNSNVSPSQPLKKKRNLPGNPDPNAEVIALSPKTLLATNRFVCEICNKGFQRDQNLQLHRRGHNLSWKLKQRTNTEIKKRVYVCPEPSCVHHNPTRALGDLTGVKKHFCRKHGEKKLKCDKCSKKYAVQSDWKAHSKTCGTKEYKCDCGTIFSRRDSFITHRAFCDVLTEENNKPNQEILISNINNNNNDNIGRPDLISMPINKNKEEITTIPSNFNHNDNKIPLSLPNQPSTPTLSSSFPFNENSAIFEGPNGNLFAATTNGSASMSATALLQKAASMGATTSTNLNSTNMVAPLTFRDDDHDHVRVLRGINGGYFPDHLGLFNGVIDQNNALFKNIIFHDEENSRGVGNISNIPSGLSRFSGDDVDVMTTVDFLGVGGGSRSILNLEECQNQEMEKFRGLSQFEQQNPALEKN